MQFFESYIIIEISLLLLILVFALLGYVNKFISEFQKTTNLFLSILLSKLVAGYFIDTNSFYLIFIISLISANILIGFSIDMIVYNLNIIKIDENVDEIIGATLGIIKGLLIITLIIFIFESILTEFHIDNNINIKVRQSYIYSFSEYIKNVILFKVN